MNYSGCASKQPWLTGKPEAVYPFAACRGIRGFLYAGGAAMKEKEKQPLKRFSAAWLKVLIVVFLLCITGFLLQAVFLVPVTGFLKDLFYMKYLPNLEDGANFGILFVFGLLTSIHCVGMCGGLVLSQSIEKPGVPAEKESSPAGRKHVVLPSAFYNAGRLISYTVIGGLIGGLGQTLALSGVLKGLLPVIGGVFMILMAVNMLGIFAGLRRLQFGLPKGILKKLGIGRPGYRSPFIVGLLTGLMPCGPMQIIQIYALGTRSILIGAVSMLCFALGTTPGLFGFGVLGSYISKGASRVILRASALLVAILGVVMLSRGLALMGVQILPVSADSEYVRSQVRGSVQTVSIDLETDSFQAIEVYEGIPVEWTIHADKENLNDCNNEIIVPEYSLDIKLKEGDTLAVFTPAEQGEYVYTCWMGMIKSKIRVIDNPDPDYSGLTASTDTQATAVQTKPCSMGDAGAASCPGKETTTSSAALQEAAAIAKATQSSTASKTPTASPSVSPAAASSSQPGASSATTVMQAPSSSTQPPSLSPVASVTPAVTPKPDNSSTVRTLSGYLIDTDCLALYPDPSEETRSCLLMSACAASGYGITCKDVAGNTVFYLFDGNIAGNPADTAHPAAGGQLLAYSFISNNVSDSNRSVSVKGSISSDIYTDASGQSYLIFAVSSIELLT